MISMFEQVAADVLLERRRQEHHVVTGRFSWTAADDEVNDALKLPILVEEVGEVARLLCDRGKLSDREYIKNLYEELVQSAAVAVAWAEAVRRKLAEPGAWEEAVQ